VIRQRVKNYHAHGIRVEGTVILGTDDQDEDAIRRLVDFLLEIELDIAEFTILTPFPHTPIRAKFEQEGRVLTSDWSEYTCDRVVFQPRRMTPARLREMYDFAWDTSIAIAARSCAWASCSGGSSSARWPTEPTAGQEGRVDSDYEHEHEHENFRRFGIDSDGRNTSDLLQSGP